MAKREDWIEKTTWIRKAMLPNDCIELIYVETDKTGAYVIKEIVDKKGNTIKRIKDVILDFPIELLEMKRMEEFDSRYPTYEYRININGKEYIDSVKQIRLLIQKRVIKQPFYSKYGHKFRDYIRIALRTQEKELEKRGAEI